MCSESSIYKCVCFVMYTLSENKRKRYTSIRNELAIMHVCGGILLWQNINRVRKGWVYHLRVILILTKRKLYVGNYVYKCTIHSVHIKANRKTNIVLGQTHQTSFSKDVSISVYKPGLPQGYSLIHIASTSVCVQLLYRLQFLHKNQAWKILNILNRSPVKSWWYNQ